jgi:polyisoprenoid-binding protein YceI
MTLIPSGQTWVRTLAWLAPLVLSVSLAPVRASDLDATASKVAVRVYKSGLFSAFAHDHTIAAPIASGHLDLEKRSVELKFHTQEMRVVDAGVKDSERAEIESTMKSDKVLDVSKFAEISFVSTQIETASAEHFLVHGSLTLHGVTKLIELPVAFSGGRYTGSVKLKQTDFGITPVVIAGGTVKVKDVIEIIFEIVPAN